MSGMLVLADAAVRIDEITCICADKDDDGKVIGTRIYTTSGDYVPTKEKCEVVMEQFKQRLPAEPAKVLPARGEGAFIPTAAARESGS